MVSDVNLHLYTEGDVDSLTSGGGGGAGAGSAPAASHPKARVFLFDVQALGRDAQPTTDWSTSVNHNTLVYQYRLCYRMPLYCTGALSRSVTKCRPITRAGCTSLETGVPFDRMMFFDDCNWGDHCLAVSQGCVEKATGLGPVTVRTPR